jgi:hypothetical protein
MISLDVLYLDECQVSIRNKLYQIFFQAVVVNGDVTMQKQAIDAKILSYVDLGISL